MSSNEVSDKKKDRHRSSDDDSRKGSSSDDSSYSSARDRKRKRHKDSKKSKKDKRSRRHDSSDSEDNDSYDRKKKDKKKKSKKKSDRRRSDSESESDASEDRRPAKKERFTTDSDEERKQRKEKKKVEKVAKALGYSNDLNPFGDANLLTPFEWGKKKTTDKPKSVADKEDEEKNRLKLMTEIEKVRKRRQDREAELAEMERLRDEEQRLREMAAFGDWQHKEEEFHLEQTMERARLRLLDYRDRPIDRCIKNFILILAAEKLLKFHQSHHDASHREYELRELRDDIGLLKLPIELENPVDIVQKLGADKLQHLSDELELHLALDKDKGGNRMVTFWEALKTVVQSRLRRFREAADGRPSSLHESIASDVAGLLHGKSEKDLNLLENDIRGNLAPGKVVDIEYWEVMLEEVILQRAKAVVIQQHVAMVQQLQTMQRDVRETGLLDKAGGSGGNAGHHHHHGGHNDHRHHDQRHHHRDDGQSRDDQMVRNYLREMQPDGEYEETDLKMAETDEIQLDSVLDPNMVAGVEALLEDKYRPRKPRYFNRVRTGWDRNKYNLTHYDSDNPPPVRIQGYKFTIFYPDLIDKTKTPRYFIEPCPDCDNHEFVIIRFHAGPPYEDIAFKIVNREWDTHRRAGFVNVFDRGILQLHFSFKRAFYRR